MSRRLIFVSVFLWTFAAFSQTVTTLTLATPVNHATLGTPVKLTATITPAATGVVTFYNGPGVLGYAPLSGGKAVLNATALPAGANALRAYYGGSTLYMASSSPTLAVTVNAIAGGALEAAAGSPVTVGMAPNCVVAGDFNGDGVADLATANRADNSVTILLGNGSGGFRRPNATAPVAGSLPDCLATGDFNGDGKADLAVSNRSANTVTVLLGDGSGGFAAAPGSPVAVGIMPGALAVGDVDGDGNSDLVVVNSGGGNIAVLLGDGTGGFTGAPGSPLAVGVNPESVALGDFNGDGNADLAVANTFDGTMTVLLGDGSAGFTMAAGSPFAVGTNPESVVVGDFDKDGNADLAVANTLDGAVAVLLGNGGGGFAAAAGSPFGAGSGPVFVTVGDFNGDGDTDLAIANQNAGIITLLAGNGSGGFSMATASPLGVGSNPTSIAVGDFNGDGKTDLAVANYGSNNVTIELGAVPQSQTLTFGPLANQPLTAAPITINAAATSGLSVGFTSNTPGVCTVFGPVATILAAGRCSITATQRGDATYSAAAPVTQSFTVLYNDVPASAYYYNAVNLFTQYGITAGCGNNNYCPDANVTRAQMAVFIVSAIFRGGAFTSSATPHFSDVQPGDFGFAWIQAMYELGISAGCGGGNYCPDDPVTRDSMAVFIIVARFGAGSAFSFPSTPYFTDVPLSDGSFKFVQRMKLDGITGGCTATTFCPASPVTRGQMAVFMMAGLFNQLLAAGTPVIGQVSPLTLGVGTSAKFTITGANTNFVQGTTALSPISGVTIGAITVTSATSLTAQLTAAANAIAKPRSIVAITNSEQAVVPNGLFVQ
jgi:Bacterial Ig-like domain (group 3)/FG-GAP-like repeat/S-layer homology domain